jgi:phosphoribosylaminoimidazolecarboxamide formyltransferase/IMP cyclohydrolase
MKIERALLTVSNKAGITLLARELVEMGVEIISTGGTEKKLREEGIPVTPISEFTGFPEMLDGRVKTLHPAIHAGLLADRSNPAHLKQLEEMGIKPIDLVVVNLYPFAETVSKGEISLEEAVEQIDIGGVALIRAAAKNFQSVAVVTNPKRYSALMREMSTNEGSLSLETRRFLAAEAFRHTSHYDAAIYAYLARKFEEFPENLTLVFNKIEELRYGENPHQRAAYYREVGAPPLSLVNAEKLHGKALSFNNVLDLNAAWMLVKEFEEPAAVIVKHNIPCGAAVAADLASAFRSALECDPVSAFGGIIALNRKVDEPTARQIASIFIEAVIAPSYSEEARAMLSKKADLRLMRLELPGEIYGELRDFKRVDGGLLIQELDQWVESQEQYRVATSRAPSDEEWEDLLFAWKVAKHVRSNAIVLAKNRATVGIGAGQMSRVDATWVALGKAKERASGSVLASDAFFPFADAVEMAAGAGVSCIIQPGGSLKDEEVIAAAERLMISMVMTGFRHFRH